VVVRLERCADLHMAQLMPLPLTVTCFSKIQIGFTFLVPADLGSPGKRAVKRMRVCVWLYDTNNKWIATKVLTKLIFQEHTDQNQDFSGPIAKFQDF